MQIRWSSATVILVPGLTNEPKSSTPPNVNQSMSVGDWRTAHFSSYEALERVVAILVVVRAAQRVGRLRRRDRDPVLGFGGSGGAQSSSRWHSDSGSGAPLVGAAVSSPAVVTTVVDPVVVASGVTSNGPGIHMAREAYQPDRRTSLCSQSRRSHSPFVSPACGHRVAPVTASAERAVR